jgi:serine/threonine protein kinase/Tfp pilus assembly protein PilF
VSLSDQQQRARAIVWRALECSEEQREAWLQEECEGDEELIAAVRALLEKEEQATLTGGGHDIQPGSRIGPYTLRQSIGEGGFAEVFLAGQEEPVRRRVALKVLKPGMDSREVLARFEVERQALALMQHPGIASILDAGITENGRSWFAMEYVDGLPLTEYCDTHRLNLRERLELFTGVCEAVQHAHQKGIIHRDLKPSNILVGLSEGTPRAKVIDFGIAKAAGPRLTEKTLFTAQGVLVGTPAYMSPEQAGMSGADIDTRSDVYSLGILLYELLSGEPPFHPRRLLKAGYGEILRIIREEEPQRPSTKSTTIEEAGKIAQARQLNVTTLRRRLNGDLDWIAIRALEKDRTRRYATVQELSADLGRHLANEPVSAGPPSVRYRFVKFVRRNRVGLSVAAIIVLGLAGSITAVTWQANQTNRVAQTAEGWIERAATLEEIGEVHDEMLLGLDAQKTGLTLMRLFREAITEQLTETKHTQEEIDDAIELFSALAARTDPTNIARELLYEEVLISAEGIIDSRFTAEPLMEAKMRATLATVYQNMGLLDKAKPLLERALALYREHLGDDHPHTLIPINSIGELLQEQGKLDEAEPYLREALATRRRVLGNDHPDTLRSISDMGSLLKDQEKFDEAEAHCHEALAKRRRVLGDDHPDTLISINNMGTFLSDQGKNEEAEPYHREALERMRRVLGDEHLDTLRCIRNMGIYLQEREKFEEAEPYFRERLEGSRRILGDVSLETIESFNELALFFEVQEKFGEAESYLREALERSRRVFGDKNPQVLTLVTDMGWILKEQEKHEEAEPYFREALEGRRRVLGDEHPDTLYSISNMGWILGDQGKYEEAEPYSREALEKSRRVLGNEHPDTLLSISDMGSVLYEQEKFDVAEPYLREALEGRRRVLGGENPDTLTSINNMGALLAAQGKNEEAEPHLREALEGRRRVLGKAHGDTLDSILSLGNFLHDQGELDEAEALAGEALKLEPEDKEHQERFSELLNDIEEARKKKTAEEPDTEKEGKPAKAP